MSLWSVGDWVLALMALTLAVVTPWIMVHRYANTRAWWIRFARAYFCQGVAGIALSVSLLVPAEPVRIIAEVIALIVLLAIVYLLVAAGRSA